MKLNQSLLKIERMGKIRKMERTLANVNFLAQKNFSNNLQYHKYSEMIFMDRHLKSQSIYDELINLKKNDIS